MPSEMDSPSFIFLFWWSSWKCCVIFDEVDYVRLIIRCYFRSIIFYIFQLFFLTLAWDADPSYFIPKCLHVLCCTLKTKTFSLSAMDIPCNITEVLPDETRIVNHTQEPIINWSTTWRNVNFKKIRCIATEQLLKQSGFFLQHPTDMQNEVYSFFIFHTF